MVIDNDGFMECTTCVSKTGTKWLCISCLTNRARIHQLTALVRRFVELEPDDCQYDNNDLCQAHSLHERPCPHEAAKWGGVVSFSSGGKRW